MLGRALFTALWLRLLPARLWLQARQLPFPAHPGATPSDVRPPFNPRSLFCSQLVHVAQLAHLLPEALSLEWVKLPVAAHSSRTETHLLISLDAAAAGAAGADAGAAPGGGEMQAARHLLQCRLAGHLVGSYREHLAARAAEARAAGDDAAAEELEAAAAAAADPPVKQWVQPYPEAAADVPQQPLPQRPDAATPSRGGGSPAVLQGAPAAAAAALPATPATTGMQPPPSTTGTRHGRPPMHPNSTVDRQRLLQRQRRLSFGAAAAGASAAAAAAATPSREALAAAAGQGLENAAPRGRRLSTPLEQLASHLQAAPLPAGDQGSQQPPQPSQQQQVHASQAELAASLEGEEWGGAGAILSQEDAAMLAGMPEELRRMSTDGIISLDTLRVGGWVGAAGVSGPRVSGLAADWRRVPAGRASASGHAWLLPSPAVHLCLRSLHPPLPGCPQKLDAAESQHRRLSSKEAVAAREVAAALGELPRTFSRLQRIFGVQVGVGWSVGWLVGRAASGICAPLCRHLHPQPDPPAPALSTHPTHSNTNCRAPTRSSCLMWWPACARAPRPPPERRLRRSCARWRSTRQSTSPCGPTAPAARPRCGWTAAPTATRSWPACARWQPAGTRRAPAWAHSTSRERVRQAGTGPQPAAGRLF